MITTEQIKSLKQNNISVDAEITKQRTEQVWKAAKNAAKNDVVALAGCAKGTIYRVFQTGSISIKLAIAIGQVLNVNPNYLAGAAGEPGEFTDALLLQILELHGYQKLLAEIAPPSAEEEVVKPKRKYTRRQKPAPEEAAPPPAAEVEAAQEAAPEPVPEVVNESAPLPDIPEEDLQALLHSLVILSKAGITNASDKLAQVKGILIS